MNWKRVTALGLLGLTFGMGQSYAIDVNIPGADASIPADKYQNYRVDTADTKILESKIIKKVTEDNQNKPGYDISNLPRDIHNTTELNHAIKYSSTVFILRDHGADIKFTMPYASIMGIAYESAGPHKEVTRHGGALGFDGEMSYELRPQPKGDTWENSGIPYKQLTADQLKSLLENKKMTLHKNNYSILGAGLFTYPTVEKGTWDIASYDSKNIRGTINFTMPNQPTVSYHLIYAMPKNKIQKLNQETIIRDTMSPLANIVLPSVKAASDIMPYTSEVHKGPFAFRVLKDSKLVKSKSLEGGLTMDFYKSGKIREIISVSPLSKYDDVKKQNILYNYLLAFIGSPKLSQGKPAQYATVWNDTLPGAYFEIKGDKYSLFVMTVYDDTHRYTYYMSKPHDVHVSNYKLRDIVQYVTYTNTKDGYKKTKLGLGMPSRAFSNNRVH